jgi:hypothetical protein
MDVIGLMDLVQKSSSQNSAYGSPLSDRHTTVHATAGERWPALQHSLSASAAFMGCGIAMIDSGIV